MKALVLEVTGRKAVLLLPGAGCRAEGGADERISVVTTIFPQYDFIREIAGDRVELHMLLKPGAEAHSYEPSPQEIMRIQKSDLFVYGISGHNRFCCIQTCFQSLCLGCN